MLRAPLMMYTYEGFQFQVYPIGRKQPLKYKFLDFASVKIDAGYYEPTYCVHIRNSENRALHWYLNLGSQDLKLNISTTEPSRH